MSVVLLVLDGLTESKLRKEKKLIKGVNNMKTQL